ncbi:MAG: hypothetical protein KF745_02555 [Phycisphaeraceae bacterium]|nr:hypothetical protein [Phycisphaeraceae bacterium]
MANKSFDEKFLLELDLSGLLDLRDAVVKRLKAERNRMDGLMEKVTHAIGEAFDSHDGAPKRGRTRASRPGRGRGRRGEGWEIVRSAIESKGGKAKAADIRPSWGNRSTPLSVALASYVKSGRLKKSGKGRDAVFTLAKGE